MTANLKVARQFLTTLDPRSAAVFHFQTFDDSKQDRLELVRAPGSNLKSLPAALKHLDELNDKGAGVFVAVNEHPFGGPRDKLTTKLIRAVMVDLDGSPIEPVYRHPLKPQIIVQSSPGKYHAYWLIELDGAFRIDDYTPVMRRIRAIFNGDPSICESARVMRLPGFLHLKGTPFRTELVTCPAPSATVARYSAKTILETFPPLNLDASDVHDHAAHRGLLTPPELVVYLRGLDPVRFREHDRWFRLMTVCHLLTDGDGEVAFVDWSTSDPKYANDGRTIGKRWRTLGRDGGSMSSAATMVHMLKEEGSHSLAGVLMDKLDRAEDQAFEALQDNAPEMPS